MVGQGELAWLRAPRNMYVRQIGNSYFFLHIVHTLCQLRSTDPIRSIIMTITPTHSWSYCRVATVAESSDLFVLTISAFTKAAAAAGIEVVSSHTVTGEKRCGTHAQCIELGVRFRRRLKVKQRLGKHSDYLASTSTPTSPPLCHPNQRRTPLSSWPKI